MAQKLKISTFGSASIPIVFLHGWGLNSAIWQPLIDLVDDSFQVITVDLPGFGDNNQLVPKEYSLVAIAKMIVEAVNQPAVYLGWSLGGQIASQIALSFPEHVKALVTVASTPCFEQRENWPGIQPIVLKSFHQQLNKDVKATLEGFLKIQAMGSPHLRQDIKLLRDLVMAQPLPDKQALSAGLNLLKEADLREQLVQIQQPFLRLYGKLDSLVPKTALPLIEQLAPQSEAIVFDKASHAPFISHLTDFSQTLNAWLLKVINAGH